MINRSFVRQWAGAPEELRLGDKVDEVTLYICGIQYRYVLCQYSTSSRFPLQSSPLYIFILISSSSAAHHGLMSPRSRGFVITHNDAPQPGGLLWTSDQLVVETATWQHTQQINIPAPDGIRTRDCSRRAAVDLRLRPRGHWDRLTHTHTHGGGDRIVQSVLRLTTGWKVLRSTSGGSEIIRTCLDRPYGPPSRLHNGY
jgi:hypothetical protein